MTMATMTTTTMMMVVCNTLLALAL